MTKKAMRFRKLIRKVKLKMAINLTENEMPRKLKKAIKEIRKRRKRKISLVILLDRADPFVSCLAEEVEVAVLIPRHVAVHVRIAFLVSLNLA